MMTRVSMYTVCNTAQADDNNQDVIILFVVCTIKFKNKLTQNEFALNKLLLVENNKFYMASAIAISCALLFSINAQSALAHQRALFTIGGKDYLLVVGSQNEPVFVDDKSGVELFAYIPDPKDPMNSFANGSKPVEGLEKH
jgi:hypothetical protein